MDMAFRFERKIVWVQVLLGVPNFTQMHTSEELTSLRTGRIKLHVGSNPTICTNYVRYKQDAVMSLVLTHVKSKGWRYCISSGVLHYALVV